MSRWPLKIEEKVEEVVKEIEQPIKDTLAAIDLSTSQANPHGDPICTGCGGPINTPTIHDDKGIFHGPDCYAKYVK